MCWPKLPQGRENGSENHEIRGTGTRRRTRVGGSRGQASCTFCESNSEMLSLTCFLCLEGQISYLAHQIADTLSLATKGGWPWFGIVFHYVSASPEYNIAGSTRRVLRGCPMFDPHSGRTWGS